MRSVIGRVGLVRVMLIVVDTMLLMLLVPRLVCMVRLVRGVMYYLMSRMGIDDETISAALFGKVLVSARVMVGSVTVFVVPVSSAAWVCFLVWRQRVV